MDAVEPPAPRRTAPPVDAAAATAAVGALGVPPDVAPASAPGGPRTLADLKAEHRPPPRPGAWSEELAEQPAWRNYVRDLVLGFNDGVVSVYALCAGVAGAAFSTSAVATAGLAGALAGAISMGLGEYVSTKSQREYYDAEARLELKHVRAHPELERAELQQMYLEKGYPAQVVQDLVEHVSGDERRFVETMMREEFGVGREADRSPLRAMGLVMAAFLVGSALAVLPFVLRLPRPVLVATATSLAGLFVAGELKARASGLRQWRSGAEMMVLGAAAGAVTYGLGRLVGGIV